MTREEALAQCGRLAREHTHRATHSWLPRELAPGQWAVVKVGAPAQRPLGTRVEARPRGDRADDPRPAFVRNVG